jgi:heme-degrading monooxygenase HmoA
MYARNVSFRLKSNMQSDYTRTFENQVLPLLRKQKGFKDEITLTNPDNQDAVTITLWESKSNADEYNTNTYPQVLKTLSNVIEGTPKVNTFETVMATFHNVPVAV